MADRRKLFVFVPLALGGAEGAHAVANALLGAPAEEIFSESSPTRMLLPPLVALLGMALLAGIVLRPDGRTTRRQALLLGHLAPVSFVIVELCESRFEGTGWHFLLTATFAVGLALQLPVVLLAYALARLLLRLGDALEESLARLVPSPHAAAPPDVAAAPASRVATSPRLARLRGRAPPASALLPG